MLARPLGCFALWDAAETWDQTSIGCYIFSLKFEIKVSTGEVKRVQSGQKGNLYA